MSKPKTIRRRFEEVTDNGRAKILHFEEEARKVLTRAVEKGREKGDEGRRRLEALVEKAPLVSKVRESEAVAKIEALRNDVEEQLEGGMDRFLAALGVATRAEMQKLEKRVASLTRKVNALTKAQKPAPAKKATKAKKRPAAATKRKARK